ncbi:hypothetical protein D3C72_859160 [compost metagenome]
MQKHQPFTRQLAQHLIQMGHPVGVVDLDEMQGIPRSGDHRGFTPLEHYQFEIAHAAGQQAIEGCLKANVIVGQIQDHECNLAGSLPHQMRLDPLAFSHVGRGSIKRSDHLARSSGQQTWLLVDTRHLL